MGLPMPFGNPNTYPGHSGVDFPQPDGTPIRASGNGVVGLLNKTERGGWTTWIDYDGGPGVAYAHQWRHYVPKGMRVTEGTVIGYVGSSGHSTGPHLHIEIADQPGEAAVWRYFDRGRVVGGGGAGAGGSVGGNLTSRPTADIQRLVGATADGVYGPDTTAKVAAWQGAHGLEADGVWGPLSDAVGFPAGAPGQITVDGVMGPQTAMKLQERLGVEQDGQIGPITTRAIQTALGVAVDGDWGQQTTRALQAAVGATVDGVMGPETVSKLQAFLNTGQPFPKVGDPAPAPAPAPQPGQPVTERVSTYPGASKAYNVPLGDGFRAAGVVVDRFIIHHTAATSDQLAYFQSRNDRESCPNYYVRSTGEVIELIPPNRRPSSTGSANSRSVAVEVQNTSGAPDWGISEASRASVARLASWLSKQTRFGDHDVQISLDRQHVIGHNEAGVNATACPGPSMNVDGIVAMARDLEPPVIVQPEPEPTPEPEPVPLPDVPEPTEPEPITRDDLETVMATIPKVTVDPGALGSIITDPGARRRVYGWNTIIGMAIIAVTAGIAAAGVTVVAAGSMGWPVWMTWGAAILAGISGAYTSVQPQVTALANANTNRGGS